MPPDSTASTSRPRPNPRPFRVLTDGAEGDRARRLDCADYSACLEQAVVMSWRGFTCASCRAYHPLTADARARDLVPLCLLAQRIGLGADEPPVNDNAPEGT